MKPLAIGMTLIVLLTCVTFVVGTPPDSSQPLTPALSTAVNPTVGSDSPLIVHEWGTFTSFSGSDGVKLEFRPLVDQDLPPFVVGSRGWLNRLLSKSSLRAIQRMETPVTYFYTPVERDVSVRVEFPEGLLTEYFPPVRTVSPERQFTFFGPQPDAAEGTQLKEGALDWGQVHLIPTSSLRAHVADEELSRRLGRHIEQLMLEPANGFPHYEFARETDSAIVQFRSGTAPDATDYFEKFLFYRGLGNFDLPLTLTENEGTFTLVNSGNEPVRSVFLVTVQGEDVRFRRYEQSQPGSRMTLQQSDEPATIDQLAEQMVAALQAEGLYEKEARAMVKCWQSSWFGEEGTRLLYMVPTAITDRLLPLHVTPTPDEVVRILVGRMEIMPASQEEQILELVSRSAAARAKAEEDKQESFQSPVLQQLQSMGRLAEPALVRIEQIAEDAAARQEARHLIRELRDEPAATAWNNNPGFDAFPLWTATPTGGE